MSMPLMLVSAGHGEQVERIKRAPRQIHRRHRGGEQFARFVERGFELVGRETVGERGEIGGRLVEPQPAEQFAELFGMFHPRRLPGDFGDEIGFLPQTRGEFAGQFFRGVGIRRAQRHHQFAGVGEMLLVKFQPLHRRLVRRQQIEHVHVEAQPREAEADGHEQQAPTTSVSKTNSRRQKSFHGFAGAGIFQPPAAIRLCVQSESSSAAVCRPARAADTAS